jgi:hypothetical protein
MSISTRRKLAVLSLYVDSEETQEPSTHLHEGGLEHEIVLRPNYARQPNHIEQEYPLDALAHELGHFVASVFGLREHLILRLSDALGIEHPLAPAEIEAWDFAKKINPAIEKSPFPVMAIRGYEERDEALFGIQSKGLSRHADAD